MLANPQRWPTFQTSLVTMMMFLLADGLQALANAREIDLDKMLMSCWTWRANLIASSYASWFAIVLCISCILSMKFALVFALHTQDWSLSARLERGSKPWTSMVLAKASCCLQQQVIYNYKLCARTHLREQLVRGSNLFVEATRPQKQLVYGSNLSATTVRLTRV